MQRAYRLTAALASLLALSALLTSCGSSDEDAGAFPGEGWQFGGQTGSLMPVCGLTPASTMSGVPASAPGFVLLPSQCPDARVLDALTVRDGSGQPIPFEVESLPGGELLVVLPDGLTPGDYTIGVAQAGDEDGGVEPEPDAGLGPEPAFMQSVTVQDSAPQPTRFGEVSRIHGECGAVLELTPDASVRPFLGSLSVELQIDAAPSRTLVLTGTLKLVGDSARIALPESEIAALGYGEHELRVTVRLAGESAPLETFLLTLAVPCSEAGDDGDEPMESTCSVTAPRATSTGYLTWLAAPLAWLMVRRARARRSPAPSSRLPGSRSAARAP